MAALDGYATLFFTYLPRHCPLSPVQAPTTPFATLVQRKTIKKRKIGHVPLQLLHLPVLHLKDYFLLLLLVTLITGIHARIGVESQ